MADGSGTSLAPHEGPVWVQAAGGAGPRDPGFGDSFCGCCRVANPALGLHPDKLTPDS